MRRRIVAPRAASDKSGAMEGRGLRLRLRGDVLLVCTEGRRDEVRGVRQCLAVGLDGETGGGGPAGVARHVRVVVGFVGRLHAVEQALTGLEQGSGLAVGAGAAAGAAIAAGAR